MAGVDTVTEALKRSEDTEQVTFTTTTLSGGSTHNIELDVGNNKIDTLSFLPNGIDTPSRATIFLVRPLVDSGSTDTDFFIYEDSGRNDVSEVFRIESLSVNDGVSSFQPGGGAGVPFRNQSGENRWYLKFVENSGNDSVYKVRMRWIDLSEP